VNNQKTFTCPVLPSDSGSKRDPRIKHLIVLMLENRSFDHMLGYSGIPGVDGPSTANTNKDKSGKSWQTSPDASSSGLTDPGHDFDDVCTQLYRSYDDKRACSLDDMKNRDPGMQGFIRSYEDYEDRTPETIMKCFTADTVPVLTKLAREYAVCNRWFSSIPGPTLPNRLFAHAGTSKGRLDISAEELNVSPTIFEVLDCADVPSTIYADGWTAAATFWELMKHQDQFFGTLDDFYQDCYDDNLPGYCFLEPRYSPGVVDGTFRPQNDQHPDSDIAEGEHLIFSVYQAIRSNLKVWKSSMLVIVYDEHGGTYDHVPPPPAITPRPQDVSTDPPFNFDRYGVRVPAVIVSAYTQRAVCNDVFDHTSLIATARKMLTGFYQDDCLGARAKVANTFDSKTILNLDAPRTDHVSISPPARQAKPSKPYCLNHLQISHLKQAMLLDDKALPQNLRVRPTLKKFAALEQDGPDSDYCNLDPVEAEHYIQSVLTTARDLGTKLHLEKLD
jgi:phospholipase C